MEARNTHTCNCPVQKIRVPRLFSLLLSSLSLSLSLSPLSALCLRARGGSVVDGDSAARTWATRPRPAARGRGRQSSRVARAAVGHARLAAIATRWVRPTLGPPGTDPLPAVAGEGCLVARAARGRARLCCDHRHHRTHPREEGRGDGALVVQNHGAVYNQYTIPAL